MKRRDLIKKLEEMGCVLVRHDTEHAALCDDMSAWKAFLQALEDIEDNQLVRDRLAAWRSKEGWTAWEDFEIASRQRLAWGM